MILCSPLLVFLLDKYQELLDHKQRQKGFIFQLAYSLTLEDVIYNKKNQEKFIFVNKKWPNDARTNYKSSSDLVEFIEIDEQLEKQLQEFEGEFEKNEI